MGEAFKDDLPDRWLQREAGRFTSVTFSPWDPQMKNVELRKALSMAIDRNLIADKVFNGTVTPATGWVSPVVDGYKAGACGDACIFDAAKAKAAYDAAGGYKGTLTMTYNADNAINKAYSEAICNSIKNAVGADCRAVPTVDFATFQNKLDAKELKGMFRSGWVMDYPSIENFLSPLYGKGAIGGGGSNYSEYNNPEFEKLLAQAAAAKTTDEANALYQQAEATACQGHAGRSVVVSQDHRRLLRQGDQRQGRCVRATRSGRDPGEVIDEARWDRGSSRPAGTTRRADAMFRPGALPD